MTWLDNMWYSPSWYHWPVILILLPLTLLFGLLSWLRRVLFRLQIMLSVDIAVPVIVVGNISVGGSGKTPLVVNLANLLRQAGYHPGVLSRGYGGKNAQYPMAVQQHSDVNVVGDEAILMRQHVNCPLVVDPIRSRGAQLLVQHHKCDVIICDDGLQHYGLNRDIEIVVIDGKRRCGNQLLLPAGPLREGVWRLEKADFLVLNGGVASSGEHLMTLEAGKLINVKHPSKSLSLNDLNRPVTALAGIGNPQRFFSLLEKKQMTLKQQLSFVDHHAFSATDIPSGPVIMTEKDAVKCTQIAHDDCWYLPISARLTTQFESQLLQKLQQVVADKKTHKRK
ncbi:tetraacyldisaccharide 4'-kinase [uncultured Paraglaciecola sp.]|uniref:tetraacyldisaccharide 4'-kinase n=1 Tax=uncultured Paraglaciecola sp. TaxID=1765024 RepID=UPI0026106264|nr:tetraacyldisaccharide 4'-kinase [uncultured Paraglaciecola sp.]